MTDHILPRNATDDYQPWMSNLPPPLAWRRRWRYPSAGRGDEAVVSELLAVILHELTDTAQSPVDELAVVGDALAIKDTGVQRLRVGQDDVLGAIRREQVGRPVGVWIFIQRHDAQGTDLDLGVQLLGQPEDHGTSCGIA